MTDRLSYLTVILAEDARDDDLEPTIQAILQLKGVLRVEPGKPVDASDHIARSRLRAELFGKLREFIEQETK